MDLQMGLVLHGHARAYRSPEADALPHWAVYRDMAYATTVEPLVTLVNCRGMDSGAPAGSTGELARLLAGNPARFRARVACYDIERNGLGFLALMHEMTRSPHFDAFLKALTAVQPVLFGSAATLTEAVASGRALLAFHVLGSYALRALRENPSLAIATSQTPLLAVSRIAFICRDAPHPQAAQRFLDYLLSTQGQRHLLEAGLFPVLRTGEAARADPGDQLAGASIDPIPIDRGLGELLDDVQRRELLRRWKSAIAASGLEASDS